MKLILHYMKRYKWLVLLNILSVFGFALVELGIPTMVSNMIDEGVLRQDKGYLLQSGAVIRQLDRGLGLGATMLAMADERPIDSDALGVALGKHLTSLGVEQLVFKR